MSCRNVGMIDRVVRVALGLALLVAAALWSMWLVIPGAILLATAAVGWCPLYCPLGVKTCAVVERSARGRG